MWWKTILLFLCAAPAGAAQSDAALPRNTIVFSSNRSGHWRIWAIQADGSRLRKLFDGPDDADDVDPMAAPDGRRVLFTSTRGGKVGVWLFDLAARKLERVCDGDQAEWAPDGKRIALRRNEAIFVRDLRSGKERRVSPADWPHCSGPSWSPDGRLLAFACRWDAGNAVFVVSADGGAPRKVYGRRGACEPHWSPDGKRIVFETETHVWSVRPDGSSARPVTFYGGVQRYPRYSPDGRRIVFCQAPSPEGPWELYVVSAWGGRPRRLTEGGSDMYPHWR